MTMSPNNFPESSFAIAPRNRWVVNHAVLGTTTNFRTISRAAASLFLTNRSENASSQSRRKILES